MTTLGVVIPISIESPHHLYRTLGTLVTSLDVSFDIAIVISSEVTPEIKEVADFFNCTIIQNKDLAVGEAKNRGIEELRECKYFLVVDSHMIFHGRSWIRKLIELCERKRDIGVVTVPIYDIDSPRAITYGLSINSKLGDKWNTIYSVSKEPIEVIQACGCFHFFSRDTYEESIIGYLPAMPFEACDLCLRLNLIGRRTICYPITYVGHKFGDKPRIYDKRRAFLKAFTYVASCYINFSEENFRKVLPLLRELSPYTDLVIKDVLNNSKILEVREYVSRKKVIDEVTLFRKFNVKIKYLC